MIQLRPFTNPAHVKPSISLIHSSQSNFDATQLWNWGNICKISVLYSSLNWNQSCQQNAFNWILNIMSSRQRPTECIDVRFQFETSGWLFLAKGRFNYLIHRKNQATQNWGLRSDRVYYSVLVLHLLSTFLEPIRVHLACRIYSIAKARICVCRPQIPVISRATAWCSMRWRLLTQASRLQGSHRIGLLAFIAFSMVLVLLVKWSIVQLCLWLAILCSNAVVLDQVCLYRSSLCRVRREHHDVRWVSPLVLAIACSFLHSCSLNTILYKIF
jgi:hypothetical protein